MSRGHQFHVIFSTAVEVERFYENTATMSEMSFDFDELILHILGAISLFDEMDERAELLYNWIHTSYSTANAPRDGEILAQATENLLQAIRVQVDAMDLRDKNGFIPFVQHDWSGKDLILIFDPTHYRVDGNPDAQ